MMKHIFPNFLATNNKKRIFYKTNFDPQLNALAENKKPLLVFNYGLVCSNDHWSQQIPFFDQLNYPILIHDYRGHFESTCNQDLSDCTFNQFAEDIKDILEALETPPQKVFMLGHSMGVNVTLEFSRRYGKYLKGMALISGTIIPPQDTMFDSQIIELVFPALKILEKNFPTLFKQLWGINTKLPLTGQLIRRGGFNHKQVPIEFVNSYLEKINHLGPKLFIKLFEDMNKHNLLSYLDDVSVPALIIGGEKDKVIPNHFQDVICKKLPISEFYMVKDGSHVPQVDFPVLVNERILAFIEKINLY